MIHHKKYIHIVNNDVFVKYICENVLFFQIFRASDTCNTRKRIAQLKHSFDHYNLFFITHLAKNNNSITNTNKKTVKIQLNMHNCLFSGTLLPA